ncbi:hypothetical protein BDK92_7460 [Micromonospora pisi]|uniref:Uncharacterized protein n=1 Tax=Micromonospora pisi TaxID=589240 RepID=A0A495JXP1_9ACTN|nr:hypothetical protein BDK92_7460 [Micromonospora pisi]
MFERRVASRRAVLYPQVEFDCASTRLGAELAAAGRARPELVEQLATVTSERDTVRADVTRLNAELAEAGRTRAELVDQASGQDGTHTWRWPGPRPGRSRPAPG